jgi:hypothetical protein
MFDSNMATSQGLAGSLYGFPITMVDNGGWDNDAAQLLMGDWSKAIIGVRTDISFKLFTEGVISNGSGAVVMNLMQQDAVAMRMTMRLAYATVNPVTIMQPNQTISQRFPFAAVLTNTISGTARVDSTGTATTNGSQTVGDTHALSTDAGLPITGTGIPTNTFISTVTPGVGYTVTNAATATGTPTLSVGGQVGSALESGGRGVGPQLSLSVPCPNCDASNLAQAKFCMDCGTSFGAGPDAVPSLDSRASAGRSSRRSKADGKDATPPAE